MQGVCKLSHLVFSHGCWNRLQWHDSLLLDRVRSGVRTDQTVVENQKQIIKLERIKETAKSPVALVVYLLNHSDTPQAPAAGDLGENPILYLISHKVGFIKCDDHFKAFYSLDIEAVGEYGELVAVCPSG